MHSFFPFQVLKEVYIGRLFCLLSLIKSGKLTNDRDYESLNTTVDSLLKLSRKKPSLKKLSYHAICELVQQVNVVQVAILMCWIQWKFIQTTRVKVPVETNCYRKSKHQDWKKVNKRSKCCWATLTPLFAISSQNQILIFLGHATFLKGDSEATNMFETAKKACHIQNMKNYCRSSLCRYRLMLYCVFLLSGSDPQHSRPEILLFFDSRQWIIDSNMTLVGMAELMFHGFLVGRRSTLAWPCFTVCSLTCFNLQHFTFYWCEIVWRPHKVCIGQLLWFTLLLSLEHKSVGEKPFMVF